MFHGRTLCRRRKLVSLVTEREWTDGGHVYPGLARRTLGYPGGFESSRTQTRTVSTIGDTFINYEREELLCLNSSSIESGGVHVGRAEETARLRQQVRGRVQILSGNVDWIGSKRVRYI